MSLLVFTKVSWVPRLKRNQWLLTSVECSPGLKHLLLFSFFIFLQKLSVPRAQGVQGVCLWFLHLQSLTWFLAHYMVEKTQAPWVIDFYVLLITSLFHVGRTVMKLNTAQKGQVLIDFIREQVLITWSDQSRTPPQKKNALYNGFGLST